MRTIRLKGAGVLRRAIAGLLDALPVTLLSALPWVAGLASLELYMAPDSRFAIDHLVELWILRPGVFISPVVWWTGLWILWQALWVYLGSGQTPGCRAMNVRVLDVHADPVRWPHVALRALGHALSVATLGLGWAWVLVSPGRRSWPDLLSRTYLIDES